MELCSVLCSTISLTIYQLSGLVAAAQLDRGTATLILVLIPEKLSATDSLKIWNPSKMFSGGGQSEVNKRLFPSIFLLYSSGYEPGVSFSDYACSHSTKGDLRHCPVRARIRAKRTYTAGGEPKQGDPEQNPRGSEYPDIARPTCVQLIS